MQEIPALSTTAHGAPERLPPSPAAATRIDGQHSANFPDLLRQLGGSLMVATGDGGVLILLRPDGTQVAPHAIDLPNATAIASDGERIALAASPRIIEFHNLPDVALRLHDPPRHDAVYLTRRSHVTGAVGIADMAWDGDGTLWFASTLLSSLCTLDADSAVVARWRPHFVSRCVAEDRCHLNGLALRDGKPRYATALAETDAAQGWRGAAHAGGVLIDCQEQRILARGLALPHAPRWYAGRLWLLEAGRGALVTIDPGSGARTEVARVPGFARSLDFLGPVAFIGLSQPRSPAYALDLVDSPANADSRSGIWAVHIGSGRVVALLKFIGDVTEIVSVAALPGARFPELVGGPELLSSSYALPPQALHDVAPDLLATYPDTTPSRP